MTDGQILLLVSLVLAFIYLTPPIWVLVSDRSHGGATFGWFLVTLFFSWLGLGVFLIVTKPPQEDEDGAS